MVKGCHGGILHGQQKGGQYSDANQNGKEDGFGIGLIDLSCSR